MPLVGRIAAGWDVPADQAIEGAPSSTPRTTSSAASTRRASTSPLDQPRLSGQRLLFSSQGNARNPPTTRLAKLRVIAETARDIWGD